MHKSVELFPISIHFSIFDSIVYSGLAKESLKRRREMTLLPLIRRENDFYNNVSKNLLQRFAKCPGKGVFGYIVLD